MAAPVLIRESLSGKQAYPYYHVPPETLQLRYCLVRSRARANVSIVLCGESQLFRIKNRDGALTSPDHTMRPQSVSSGFLMFTARNPFFTRVSSVAKKNGTLSCGSAGQSLPSFHRSHHTASQPRNKFAKKLVEPASEF